MSLPDSERINDFRISAAERLEAARRLRRDFTPDWSADCEVDLHCHTFHSDGYHSPAGRVFEAWRRGMKGVGVVDHDLFDGGPETLAAGEIFGLDAVPGIEFYTTRPGIEILGFFPDPVHLKRQFDGRVFDAVVEPIRRAKQRQLAAMIARVPGCFHACGFEGAAITPEDIDRYIRNGISTAGDISVILWEKYGPWLAQRGLSDSVKELHARFTTARDALFVPLECACDTSPEALTRTVADWGGVAVLAHPTELRTKEKLGNDALYETVRELRRHGLQGIEVDGFRNRTCPETGLHQTEVFEAIRRRLNREQPEYPPLLATNGGDTHNQPGEAGLELGCGLNHNLDPAYGRHRVIEELRGRQRLLLGRIPGATSRSKP